MSYPVAILIVLISGFTAALGAVIVDKAFALTSRQRHHEIGGEIFQLIGVLYSVLLAFVFSEVWAEYNTAAQAINSECGALHGAAMLADTTPGPQARRINNAILTYTRIVLQQEWAEMRERRRSPAAADAFRGALAEVAKIDEGEVKGKILGLLADAHAARETRLFQMELATPAAMWTVVIVIGVILVAFVLISGTEPPGTVVLAVSFTVSIAMVLVLVRMLDYPFEGAVAIGDGDFQKIEGQISALLRNE
jgi:hypothetical protein